MSRQTYKTDLTNEQWTLLEPWLPPPSVRGRPREHSLREIMNALFYSVDGGIKWRSMPHDLPPWQSVYSYFRPWPKRGRWEQLTTALREPVRRKAGRNPEPSAAVLDRPSVKTTEEAAADTRGDDSGNQIKGRQRPLLVETIGLVMKVVTWCAHSQDRDGAQPLLGPDSRDLDPPAKGSNSQFETDPHPSHLPPSGGLPNLGEGARIPSPSQGEG